LQAGQAGGREAFPPQTDGVAVAAEFGGDALIGGLIRVGNSQHEAAAKDESLWGGASADQHLELLTEFVRQTDRGAKGTRHEQPPCGASDNRGVRRLIVTLRYPSVQILAANL
jgi:hypothetical protein